MTKKFDYDKLEAVMDTIVKISKLFLVLALLPASASAITITISAPSSSSTTFTITGSGTAINTAMGEDNFYFVGSGNFTNENYQPWFTATGSLAFDGLEVTDVRIRNDWYDGDRDMFGVRFASGLPAGNIAVSGSSTIDISASGRTFGDLVIGTYDISDIPWFNDAPTLIIQYSSVPDTGSTAALLGVGVAALAFARRRLG